MDEEGTATNIPQRIKSRTPPKKKKTKSEQVDVDNKVVELDSGGSSNSSQLWDSAIEGESDDLDNQDMASIWMNNDPDDEVKTKSLLQYIDEELKTRATLPIGMEPLEHVLDCTNHNTRPVGGKCACTSHVDDLCAGTAHLTVDSANIGGSHSATDETGDHHELTGDDISLPHPVPPPRKEKIHSKRQSEPPKPISNGLPPTPKVHMGACFSKVFNGCPLHIHCTASWIHPASRDQHILIGAEEGIYTLNLNELHEATMEQLVPTRTTWMVVIKDVMMSISGKGPNLYRHDLIGLHNKHFHKFSLPMNKIPEKLLPRKYTTTTKVPDTKGTLKCCIGRNPYNGYKYLCGASSSSLYLMQWYDPLNKFMLLKQTDCYLPHPLRVFEMIITPDLEYPLICSDISWGAVSEDHEGPHPIELHLVDMNTGSLWAGSAEQSGTMRPRCTQINITNVTQIEKDTILVCFDNIVRVVDLQGKIKERKRITSELKFDFVIDSIVCLTDSVLAFHLHGMTGRSFKNGDVTQEIVDNSRCFRLLGSDRIITLESRPSSMGEDISQGINLYILAGHETSMY